MIKKSFFLLIAILMISCSRKTDADLYNEGRSAEVEKDFIKAAASYEEASAKFQKTVYAESSLIRLAFMYNNELKDTRKAIYCYKKYCELFPDSALAPTMLFLTGYIYNNELHMLDSARMIFETFLKKYPTHDLADDAQFEMNNLGLDPNNLLKSDQNEPKPGPKAVKK